MLRFLYWATKENGQQINFIDERLFAEGDTIYYKGEKVTITDLDVDKSISAQELKMQMEDMRYYV